MAPAGAILVIALFTVSYMQPTQTVVFVSGHRYVFIHYLHSGKVIFSILRCIADYLALLLTVQGIEPNPGPLSHGAFEGNAVFKKRPLGAIRGTKGEKEPAKEDPAKATIAYLDKTPAQKAIASFTPAQTAVATPAWASIERKRSLPSLDITKVKSAITYLEHKYEQKPTISVKKTHGVMRPSMPSRDVDVDIQEVVKDDMGKKSDSSEESAASRTDSLQRDIDILFRRGPHYKAQQLCGPSMDDDFCTKSSTESESHSDDTGGDDPSGTNTNHVNNARSSNQTSGQSTSLKSSRPSSQSSSQSSSRRHEQTSLNQHSRHSKPADDIQVMVKDELTKNSDSESDKSVDSLQRDIDILFRRGPHYKKQQLCGPSMDDNFCIKSSTESDSSNNPIDDHIGSTNIKNLSHNDDICTKSRTASESRTVVSDDNPDGSHTKSLPDKSDSFSKEHNRSANKASQESGNETDDSNGSDWDDDTDSLYDKMNDELARYVSVKNVSTAATCDSNAPDKDKSTASRSCSNHKDVHSVSTKEHSRTITSDKLTRTSSGNIARSAPDDATDKATDSDWDDDTDSSNGSHSRRVTEVYGADSIAPLSSSALSAKPARSTPKDDGDVSSDSDWDDDTDNSDHSKHQDEVHTAENALIARSSSFWKNVLPAATDDHNVPDKDKSEILLHIGNQIDNQSKPGLEHGTSTSEKLIINSPSAKDVGPTSDNETDASTDSDWDSDADAGSHSEHEDEVHAADDYVPIARSKSFWKNAADDDNISDKDKSDISQHIDNQIDNQCTPGLENGATTSDKLIKSASSAKNVGPTSDNETDASADSDWDSDTDTDSHSEHEDDVHAADDYVPIARSKSFWKNVADDYNIPDKDISDISQHIKNQIDNQCTPGLENGATTSDKQIKNSSSAKNAGPTQDDKTDASSDIDWDSDTDAGSQPEHEDEVHAADDYVPIARSKSFWKNATDDYNIPDKDKSDISQHIENQIDNQCTPGLENGATTSNKLIKSASSANDVDPISNNETDASIDSDWDSDTDIGSHSEHEDEDHIAVANVPIARSSSFWKNVLSSAADDHYVPDKETSDISQHIENEIDNQSKPGPEHVVSTPDKLIKNSLSAKNVGPTSDDETDASNDSDWDSDTETDDQSEHEDEHHAADDNVPIARSTSFWKNVLSTAVDDHSVPNKDRSAILQKIKSQIETQRNPGPEHGTSNSEKLIINSPSAENVGPIPDDETGALTDSDWDSDTDTGSHSEHEHEGSTIQPSCSPRNSKSAKDDRTATDTVCTAADDVCTTAEDVCTEADIVSTAAKEVCTATDDVCTTTDDVCTAADDVCTTADDVCTATDVVCTAADDVCTAADNVCNAAADDVSDWDSNSASSHSKHENEVHSADDNVSLARYVSTATDICPDEDDGTHLSSISAQDDNDPVRHMTKDDEVHAIDNTDQSAKSADTVPTTKDESDVSYIGNNIDEGSVSNDEQEIQSDDEEVHKSEYMFLYMSDDDSIASLPCDNVVGECRPLVNEMKENDVQDVPTSMNVPCSFPQAMSTSTMMVPSTLQQTMDVSTQMMAPSTPQHTNVMSAQMMAPSTSQHTNDVSTQMMAPSTSQHTKDISTQMMAPSTPQQSNDMSTQMMVPSTSHPTMDVSTKMMGPSTPQQSNDMSTQMMVPRTSHPTMDVSTKMMAPSTSQQTKDVSTQMMVPSTLQQTSDVSTQMKAPSIPQQTKFVSTQMMAPSTPQPTKDMSTQMIAPSTPRPTMEMFTQMIDPSTPRQTTDMSTQMLAPSTPQQTIDISTQMMAPITPRQTTDMSTQMMAPNTPRQTNDMSTQMMLPSTPQQTLESTLISDERSNTLHDTDDVPLLTETGNTLIGAVDSLECIHLSRIGSEVEKKTVRFAKECVVIYYNKTAAGMSDDVSVSQLMDGAELDDVVHLNDAWLSHADSFESVPCDEAVVSNGRARKDPSLHMPHTIEEKPAAVSTEIQSRNKPDLESSAPSQVHHVASQPNVLFDKPAEVCTAHCEPSAKTPVKRVDTRASLGHSNPTSEIPDTVGCLSPGSSVGKSETKNINMSVSKELTTSPDKLVQQSTTKFSMKMNIENSTVSLNVSTSEQQVVNNGSVVSSECVPQQPPITNSKSFDMDLSISNKNNTGKDVTVKQINSSATEIPQDTSNQKPSSVSQNLLDVRQASTTDKIRASKEVDNRKFLSEDAVNTPAKHQHNTSKSRAEKLVQKPAKHPLNASKSLTEDIVKRPTKYQQNTSKWFTEEHVKMPAKYQQCIPKQLEAAPCVSSYDIFDGEDQQPVVKESDITLFVPSQHVNLTPRPPMNLLHPSSANSKNVHEGHKSTDSIFDETSRTVHGATKNHDRNRNRQSGKKDQRTTEYKQNIGDELIKKSLSAPTISNIGDNQGNNQPFIFSSTKSPASVKRKSRKRKVQGRKKVPKSEKRLNESERISDIVQEGHQVAPHVTEDPITSDIIPRSNQTSLSSDIKPTKNEIRKESHKPQTLINKMKNKNVANEACGVAMFYKTPIDYKPLNDGHKKSRIPRLIDRVTKRKNNTTTKQREEYRSNKESVNSNKKTTDATNVYEDIKPEYLAMIVPKITKDKRITDKAASVWTAEKKKDKTSKVIQFFRRFV